MEGRGRDSEKERGHRGGREGESYGGRGGGGGGGERGGEFLCDGKTTHKVLWSMRQEKGMIA